MIHFPILVNSEPIGEVNVKRVAGMQAVSGPALYGYYARLGGKSWTGSLDHTPADGALVLLHKVLAEVIAHD